MQPDPDAPNPSEHPYADLLPEVVLDAVESCGFRTDGALHALNSYENRVYQVRLEDGRFLVAKFYRPERLTSAAILEEHGFCRELVERDIPVVAPIAEEDGETLFTFKGFRFALFPRHGGRFPNLEDPDLLLRLGRLVGRIHAVGALHPFAHRPRIEVEATGRVAYRFLLERGFIPEVHRARYRDLAEALLDESDARLAACAPTELRLHGDLHPGNILQRNEEVWIVDTDDCRTGPAVQDLWLLLSGSADEMRRQASEIIDGYDEFHSFRLREFDLVEPLRALRIIHYAYWLARRWGDPAFPRHFPWFNTGRYWDDHIHTLQEQRERMEAPPLLP